MCILLAWGIPSIFLYDPLSLSTSSSSLPCSQFHSRLPPTILSLWVCCTALQALQHSSIHSLLSLPFLIKDRGAETRREISREDVPASLKERGSTHRSTQISHTHSNAHEKCMHTWIAPYCTLQSTYSMTYFVCSTGAHQEGKMLDLYSGLSFILKGNTCIFNVSGKKIYL